VKDAFTTTASDRQALLPHCFAFKHGNVVRLQSRSGRETMRNQHSNVAKNTLTPEWRQECRDDCVLIDKMRTASSWSP
jgi:NADP-dependent 3-hydroxy acid dehydrogenase YdfG